MSSGRWALVWLALAVVCVVLLAMELLPPTAIIAPLVISNIWLAADRLERKR